jgi:hypothetical protein
MWKRPKEYHDDDTEATIAALNNNSEYNYDIWDPNVKLFQEVSLANFQRLRQMGNKREQFYGEMVSNTANGEVTDELSDEVLSSMSCPSDDVDSWFTGVINSIEELKLPNTPKNVREALDPENEHASV